MGTSPDQFAAEKGDKALALREQGLSRSEIAERLGVKPTNLAGMLQRAKQRRERFNMEKANGHKTNGIGPGHNSTLTDDEKRALTLHHKRAYEAADSLVEKAKADRTAIADLAKSDLGKGALADIKDMILADNPKKMKSVLERAQRLARWAGLNVGSQPQLFEQAETDNFEDGKTAGMSGDRCEPPSRLAQDAAQLWISGWHEGQTILAAAFKKKRPVDPPAADPNQIDLAERTDLQPAGTA